MTSQRGNEGPDTPVRWGILGAANIARTRMIPALRQSARSHVLAIASRDHATAQRVADDMSIPRAYGSYDELLADPDIDAIYNPLPNYLHVPWSIRAALAGKHVLCEKPIAMTADEARELMRVRDRTGVQISEAFMVRSHPRWHAAKALVTSGRIGELRMVSGHFSYAKKGATNIRSKVEWGGGALLDIGCYPIALARWLFDAEPIAVMATIDRDPEFGVDRHVAGILRFTAGTAAFSCSGQLALAQSMQILGTAARIEIDVPFNPSETVPTKLVIDDGRDLQGGGMETIMFDPCNQFAVQADAFVDAIQSRVAVPVSLEDSIANMTVLDALFRSAETGRWEVPLTA